ncbi:unnamed protein product [Clonostachys rosea]|uniref:Amino acid permease/ SLC12A domain-containing protein n=1 Tax=Bionectria ochroleuca TaxID=29856 RepID=A0ABY6TXR1_BIOOC|nr:unnamed protein product [Clonostachys rosea]
MLVKAHGLEDDSAHNSGEQAAIDRLAMGYKDELKREFTVIQLIGYAFTTTSSWLGIAGAFVTGVAVGGPSCVSMGLVIMLVANICIGITLSELMSAMPNAGAQYFWVMQLAPRRLVRFSAYFTGLCNVVGSCCCGAANSMAATSMILGCVKLYLDNVNFAAWQIFLIAVALNTSLVVFNLREEVLSRLATIGLYISVCCCIAIIAAVPSIAKDHTTASYIFTSTENTSGWSSAGMAFLVGLINSNWAFGALDSATHLAEETPNPSRSGPKAIMATVGVGFVTAFPLTCALMYSLSDYDRVINSATGSPLLELFYLVTNSKAAAVGMMVLVVVPYILCMINIQTYQTRIIWAFSRDNGLPLSRWLSVVHPKLHVPINALIAGIFINTLFDLLYVASTTAYNR